MSQEMEPLQGDDFSGTVPRMSRLSEAVRLRLRDEMTRQKVSQRDVAGLLDWSQSKVAHILTGHVELNVDDLAALCFALNLSVVEAVRDHGMEFCAEMTPSELRILERIRQLPTNERDAFLLLLRVKLQTNAPERHAGPLRKRKASPRS